MPKFGGTGGGGGSATFSVDGQTISVQQSGSGSISVPGAPVISYSGPLGCRGHYFTTHLTEHVSMLFRYSARDAYIAIGNDLYHFRQRPRRSRGQLVWDHQFDDRRIRVTVACPLPRGRRPLGALEHAG